MNQFFWGASTSSHQVEGGNTNDWSEWEHAHAQEWARTAHDKQEAEVRLSGGRLEAGVPVEATEQHNYISGRAADHYNRFPEDMALAHELGHNAHRFSIEWSRIEPQEGQFNQEAIDHYKQVIASVRANGMEPLVTLWHWTIPTWLAAQGGVQSTKFVQYFDRYVRMVVEACGNEVTYWMTLNEPTSVILNSYVLGVWPPGRKSVFAAWHVYHQLARAHKRAYATIHSINPQAQVGIGHAMVYAEPDSASLLDRAVARIAHFISNEYMHRLVGKSATQDYIGVQYYFHQRLRFPWRITNRNERVSDMGWELYPEGIYHVLRNVQKYGRPIYITEIGLADAQDAHRAWYIQETVEWVDKAIKDGCDVRGYLYWSLLDNFEWDKGFWPRFGLVHVDYTTLKRTPRPSAHTYKQICLSKA